MISWLHQAAIVAGGVLSVPAVLAIIVPFVTRSRERRFRIGETDRPRTDRTAIATAWGVPEVAAADVRFATRLDQLGDGLRARHQEANTLQSRYHRHVARCVCCFGLALITLGLSLTLYRASEIAEIYASAVELTAFCVAFWQWRAAHVMNRLWIIARTRVELLRQWSFLSSVFDEFDNVDPDGAKREFDLTAAAIDAAIAAATPSSSWWRLFPRVYTEAQSGQAIEAHLASYWHDTRAQYLAKAGTAALTFNDFFFYIRRRAIRQLAWFRLAQLRVERAASRRDLTMAILFIASIALALGKLMIVFASADRAELHSAINLISFGLLLTTALSAALTALYLSRNDRSLMHRYSAQERRIEEWLRNVQRALPSRKEGAASEARPPALAPGQTLLSPALREQVVEFEQLMLDELIDWIHISTHDALELGA
jgi:hypothetical protein